MMFTIFVMKSRILFSVLTAALCVCGLSASVSAQGMKPIKIEEYDMPNGLHVILYPEHSAPIVAVRVYYHVGSKNEDPTRTGFAHFFEHLMFEATDHIKRGEYAKNMEQCGGNLNAFTAQDRTVYEDNAPSNNLKMLLWSEAERMHTLHVDSIGVNTQRQVVKEERRNRYENQPYGTFFLRVTKSVFAGSKYEWTPIGEAQYIDQATIGEFQQFYKKYYVPNNATLVIAGDFQTAEAKKAVTDYFGWIPKGETPIDRPEIVIKPQTSERTETIEEKLTPLPAVAYAWLTVPEGNKDAYALDLLTTILSSGNSSRLTKRLVDQDQLAEEVSAFPVAQESAGFFAALAVARPGVDITKLRAAMDEEITKIKTQGVTEEEYQKAINQTSKDLITEASSVQSIALKLAHFYTLYHDTERVNTELSRYLAVTREDIQRVANQYLKQSGRTVLIYTVPPAPAAGGAGGQ
jgi:zinc protease